MVFYQGNPSQSRGNYVNTFAKSIKQRPLVAKCDKRMNRFLFCFGSCFPGQHDKFLKLLTEPLSLLFTQPLTMAFANITHRILQTLAVLAVYAPLPWKQLSLPPRSPAFPMWHPIRSSADTCTTENRNLVNVMLKLYTIRYLYIIVACNVLLIKIKRLNNM